MKLSKVVLGAGAAFALAATATSASGGGNIKDSRPFSWTGFYVGSHLGAAWSDIDWTAETRDPLQPNISEAGSVSQSAANVIGGGQIGVQYQFDNVVAGVEVSLSGTVLSDKTVTRLVANTGQSSFDATFTSKVDNLFLAVGRIGFAHDNSLTYVKGGFASARVELDTFLTEDSKHLTSSSKQRNGSAPLRSEQLPLCRLNRNTQTASPEFRPISSKGCKSR